jgi:hypothetical protein
MALQQTGSTNTIRKNRFQIRNGRKRERSGGSGGETISIAA